MAEIHSVHAAGATLAHLLHAAAVNPWECDGLLFGRVQRRVHSEFRDDDASGAVTTEEVHVLVTSSLCSATLGSFYDSSGRVNERALQQLITPERDPLVGWFISRPAPTAQLSAPSMREAAVCAGLQQWKDTHLVQQSFLGRAGSTAPTPPQRLPLLLALLNQRYEHSGATLTMNYRFFQHVSPLPSSPGPPRLLPLELRILNLQRQAAGHHSSGGSSKAGGSGSGPGLGLLLDTAVQGLEAGMLGLGRPVPDVTRALAAAATAAESQAAALEQQHQELLRCMHGLCKQAHERVGLLDDLQRERAQLEARLAQQAMEAADA